MLRSPSIQYDSVCISISLETVLWKAKISSSAVNRVKCSAASWREDQTPGLEAYTLQSNLTTLQEDLHVENILQTKIQKDTSEERTNTPLQHFNEIFYKFKYL